MNYTINRFKIIVKRKASTLIVIILNNYIIIITRILSIKARVYIHLKLRYSIHAGILLYKHLALTRYFRMN
jgi:hypothetical protein